MRTPHPPVVGTVETWHGEEGWGVLRTPDDLTVFCHFSDVEVEGYAELSPGSIVWFDYETPGQDGCDARVLTAARPGSTNLDVPLGELIPKMIAPPSSAYQSRLSLRLDDADGGTVDDWGT